MSNGLEKIQNKLDLVKLQYLDCIICPEERHCCTNFSPSFRLHLTEEQIETLIPPNEVIGLVENGSLIWSEDNYALIRGKCPLLSSSSYCSVHEQKQEFGLEICSRFPIYISYSMREDAQVILVDYRCFSIEHNWTKILKVLKQISREYLTGINVRFLYQSKSQIYPLPAFNDLKNNSLLPQQRIS